MAFVWFTPTYACICGYVSPTLTGCVPVWCHEGTKEAIREQSENRRQTLEGKGLIFLRITFSSLDLKDYRSWGYSWELDRSQHLDAGWELGQKVASL